MRVVSRQELMRLPAGTLYWELNVKNGSYRGVDICVLGESFDNGRNGDFFTHGIHSPQHDDSVELGDREADMLANGTSYPIDLVHARDGLFDDTNKYLIYETGDLTALLAEILPAYPDANIKRNENP